MGDILNREEQVAALKGPHKRYLAKVMSKHVAAMGTTVSDEQYLERYKKCKGCKFSGSVQPLPGVVMEGCQKCGCPFITKLKMKTINRKAEDLGTPLNVKEVLTHRFSGESLVPEVVRCSNYAEGDFWSDVEYKFE